MRIEKKTRKDEPILGVYFNSTNREGVLSFVEDKLKKKSKFFITTPNPEILVAAYKNPSLQRAISESHLILPDGLGVKFAHLLLNFKVISRVRGRDAFIWLLSFANEKKLKVYYLGAEEKVNEEILSWSRRQYPNIGTFGRSGFRLNNDGVPVSDGERRKEREVVSEINRISPDFLFIAFGAPKQELWLTRNLSELSIRGAMVVGGSFDYYSGSAILPPSFISSFGFEWLWRLFHEPKRLLRVYRALIVFPFLVVKQRLGIL